MIMMQYGQTWKRTRAYFHQYFSQTAVENYRGVQVKYAKYVTYTGESSENYSPPTFVY